MKKIIFKPGKGPAQLRFALSASFRIWKACWEINQALGISLALFSPPIQENSDGSGLNSDENEKSPEELVYSFVQAWREYRLMTTQTAGLPNLKGFHFILEIESEKSDGLPDAESVISNLKATQAFSAVILID